MANKIKQEELAKEQRRLQEARNNPQLGRNRRPMKYSGKNYI